MATETLRPNLKKVDMSPNGIFFMSYDTPVAYIRGRTELVTEAVYSAATTRHLNFLQGRFLKPSAEKVNAQVLGALAKEAGIRCDY